MLCLTIARLEKINCVSSVDWCCGDEWSLLGVR